MLTGLNTSENHSRHLSAAVRASKSQNISILLLGELFGAVQKADLVAGKAFSVSEVFQIVSEDGFSTYMYPRVLIPLITHVLLGTKPPPCVPLAGGTGRAGWAACLCILPMLLSSLLSLLTLWPAILPQALKKSQLEIGLHNKRS